MKAIKFLTVIFIFILLNTSKSFSLIEVDITRGNLNPLPIAVSPLSQNDKSKKISQNKLNLEDLAETTKKQDKVTQSQDPSMNLSALTLSEEDSLKAQIFGCWSIPLGLPYNENLLVRIKLKLKPDGTLIKTEILDHARMNMPGQGFFKVLAESALRAIQLCQPLKVPTSGYERWKELQLNFDERELLGG